MTQLEADASALSIRLRSRLVAAQGRVAELPETVRAAANRLIERVRIALDMPSRSELAELSARLAELDRRISDLAAGRVAEMSRPVPALPAAEPVVAAASEPAAVTPAPPVSEPAAPPPTPVSEPAAAAPADDAAASPTPDAKADADSTKERSRKTNRRATANKTSRR